MFRRPYFKYNDSSDGDSDDNKFYGPGGARNIDNRTKSGQLSAYIKNILELTLGNIQSLHPQLLNNCCTVLVLMIRDMLSVILQMSIYQTLNIMLRLLKSKSCTDASRLTVEILLIQVAEVFTQAQ